MWQLPALNAGATMVRLPATDWAARRIQTALLLESNEERSDLWRKLLAEEPPLLVWVLAQSAPWRDEPPGSLEAVVLWLSEHALELWLDAAELSSLDREGVARRRLAWGRQAWQAAQIPVGSSGSTWPDELRQRVRSVHGWLVDSPRSERPKGADASVVSADRGESLGWLPRWWPRGDTSDWSVGDREQDDDSSATESREPCALEVSFLGRWLGDADDGAASDLASLLRRWRGWRRETGDFERRLSEAKRAALKEFAYGASHEINNPLANIATRAQALLAEERDVERRRKLAMIAAQAFRAHEMISDLMLFARPPAVKRRLVEWNALVERVVAGARDEYRDRELRVVAPSDHPALAIELDATQCEVALLALLRNAAEWTPAGGVIELTWGVIEQGAANEASAPRRDAPGGDGSRHLIVEVADSGSGLSEAAREHLFDPFYSGREAGRGLGFGLPKCWRIVTDHGGSIEAGDSPLGGARFRIWLPIRSNETWSKEPGSGERGPATNT